MHFKSYFHTAMKDYIKRDLNFYIHGVLDRIFIKFWMKLKSEKDFRFLRKCNIDTSRQNSRLLKKRDTKELKQVAVIEVANKGRRAGRLNKWEPGKDRCWDLYPGGMYQFLLNLNSPARPFVETWLLCDAGLEHVIVMHNSFIYMYSYSGEGNSTRWACI